MKIILLKDIATLGLANTEVEVKAGYARNYLIPQKYAVEANKQNMAALAQKIAQQKERAAQVLADAQALAARLTGTPLRIAAKSGTSGKIFGSINNVQLSQAIKVLHDIDIDRRNIAILDEVKMLGNYNAQVALHPEVKAIVAFEVYDEK